MNRLKNKIVKKLLIVASLLIFAFKIQAQVNPPSTRPDKQDRKAEKRQRINAMLKHEEEGDPAFRKQNVFGIKLATDGYGLSFEKGKYLTPKRTRLVQFELNEKKNPREEKLPYTQNVNTGQINSLIYGKLNNFYQFKIGLGQQYLIGGKANKSGVAVSAIYAGGVSIGLEKPYLVDYANRSNSSDVIRKKITDSVDLNSYQLIGASGFTHGWNRLTVDPGLHAKIAMRFDYGRFNETVSAIEAGLNTEFYFKSVQQLLYNKPKNFFFNAYITILFGRRK